MLLGAVAGIVWWRVVAEVRTAAGSFDGVHLWLVLMRRPLCWTMARQLPLGSCTRCMISPSVPRSFTANQYVDVGNKSIYLERTTRFELATLTLAMFRYSSGTYS